MIMTANNIILPILGKNCLNVRMHYVNTAVQFYLVECLSIYFFLGLDWKEQNEVKLSFKRAKVCY